MLPIGKLLKLAPLLHAEIQLAAPQELGDTPQGRRRIIGITGGSFRGERLSGRVLPGGADWQVIRADGVADLDARYTLETADGALIYVRNHGYGTARRKSWRNCPRGKRWTPRSTTCARRPSSRPAMRAMRG
jgi:hypothetical protein